MAIKGNAPRHFALSLSLVVMSGGVVIGGMGLARGGPRDAHQAMIIAGAVLAGCGSLGATLSILTADLVGAIREGRDPENPSRP
jgi:hypothetical protein